MLLLRFFITPRSSADYRPCLPHANALVCTVHDRCSFGRSSEHPSRHYSDRIANFGENPTELSSRPGKSCSAFQVPKRRSIPIAAASAANASGFLQVSLSKMSRRSALWPRHDILTPRHFRSRLATFQSKREGIYFLTVGVRPRSSSKRFSNDIACCGPLCSDASFCTAAKRLPSGPCADEDSQRNSR